MKRPRIEPANPEHEWRGESENMVPAVGLFKFFRGLHRTQCPFCASWIRREAIVCPNCQRDLDAAEH